MELTERIRDRLDIYIKHYTIIPLRIVRIGKKTVSIQYTINKMEGGRPLIMPIIRCLDRHKRKLIALIHAYIIKMMVQNRTATSEKLAVVAQRWEALDENP